MNNTSIIVGVGGAATAAALGVFWATRKPDETRDEKRKRLINSIVAAGTTGIVLMGIIHFKQQYEEATTGSISPPTPSLCEDTQNSPNQESLATAGPLAPTTPESPEEVLPKGSWKRRAFDTVLERAIITAKEVVEKVGERVQRYDIPEKAMKLIMRAVRFRLQEEDDEEEDDEEDN